MPLRIAFFLLDVLPKSVSPLEDFFRAVFFATVFRVVFLPAVFLPDVFLPDVFLPDVFLPDVFLPVVFFLPEAPDFFRPAVFLATVFLAPVFFRAAFFDLRERDLVIKCYCPFLVSRSPEASASLRQTYAPDFVRPYHRMPLSW